MNLIDFAINLAAQAGVRAPKEKQPLYKHSNINGYKNFCNFCKNNIKRYYMHPVVQYIQTLMKVNFVRHH